MSYDAAQADPTCIIQEVGLEIREVRPFSAGYAACFIPNTGADGPVAEGSISLHPAVGLYPLRQWRISDSDDSYSRKGALLKTKSFLRPGEPLFFSIEVFQDKSAMSAGCVIGAYAKVTIKGKDYIIRGRDTFKYAILNPSVQFHEANDLKSGILEARARAYGKSRVP